MNHRRMPDWLEKAINDAAAVNAQLAAEDATRIKQSPNELIYKTYDQVQQSQQQQHQDRRSWQAWNEWCETVAKRVFDEQLDALLREGGPMEMMFTELIATMRQEFEQKLGELRADLTLASAVLKGEVTEIKKRDAA